MSRHDRTHWEGKYAAPTDPHRVEPPAAFLAEHADLLRPGRTLDLACGRGRNARFLRDRGHRVLAVDVSRTVLDPLHGPRIDAVQMDLDAPGFRDRSLDNVVCVNFLDRRLFPAIVRWLRPGGTLLVDTFLVDQKEIGHPRNPDFLLGRNELLRLLCDLRVLRYREGAVHDGDALSYRASAIARREGG